MTTDVIYRDYAGRVEWIDGRYAIYAGNLVIATLGTGVRAKEVIAIARDILERESKSGCPWGPGVHDYEALEALKKIGPLYPK